MAPDKDDWRGKAAFKAEDFAAFAAALDQAPLSGLKARTVELAGDVRLSPDSITFDPANLRLDSAKFAGELAFRGSGKGASPRSPRA